MGDLIELKVATALMKSEAGFGRVRMDSASFRRLNVQIGDVVEIVGKRSAVAKVMKGAIDDEGKGLIRMDGITRSNAGVTVDESVRVRKAETLPAEKIIISHRHTCRKEDQLQGRSGRDIQERSDEQTCPQGQ